MKSQSCVVLLVDLLGERMETELGGQYQDSASLCYICSGNVEKFLDAWYIPVWYT